MKALTKFTQQLGRAAVHIGAVLALACAVVIVANAPAFAPTKMAQPGEVIRLEPVMVTISAERFDAIRAEADSPLKLVQFMRKRSEV